MLGYRGKVSQSFHALRLEATLVLVKLCARHAFLPTCGRDIAQTLPNVSANSRTEYLCLMTLVSALITRPFGYRVVWRSLFGEIVTSLYLFRTLFIAKKTSSHAKPFPLCNLHYQFLSPARTPLDGVFSKKPLFFLYLFFHYYSSVSYTHLTLPTN